MTVAQALRRPTARGLACAVASGLLFSVSTVSAQKALDSGLPVALVAGARPAGACILLWLLATVTSHAVVPGPVRLRLMGTGFFTAAQILLLYQAVARISAPLATLLLYSYPALVALLSVTVLRERLGRAKAAAILISLAGILLIVGLPSGRVTVAGCLCGLGAGLCLAIYILLVSRVARNVQPIRATAWIQLGAVVTFAVVLPMLSWTHPKHEAGGWLLWLLLVGLSASGATALFLASVQRVTPTTASIACTVEPVSTALLSAAVLGINLTGWEVGGGLLILMAVVIIAIDSRHRPRPEPMNHGRKARIRIP